MKAKLTESGWEKYNGFFGGYQFQDGLSCLDVRPQDLARLGSILRLNGVYQGKDIGRVSATENMAKAWKLSAPIASTSARASDTDTTDSSSTDSSSTGTTTGSDTTDSSSTGSTSDDDTTDSSSTGTTSDDDTTDSSSTGTTTGSDTTDSSDTSATNATVSTDSVTETTTTTTKIYTQAELEAIADKSGIKGLRVIGDALGVSGKSISALITAILEKQGS